MARRTLVVTLLAFACWCTPALAASSGFNDWSCTPSAAHPEPVVLIHGLGANGPANWSFHGPALARAGYCAYALTYGQNFPGGPGGQKPIAESAQQVATFVQRVRQSTGAAKVSLVGHSEGAFLSLYVPKLAGIGGQVSRVVALAPPTHGTTLAGIVTLGQALGGPAFVSSFPNAVGCRACSDLITGGPAVRALNEGPIVQPGIAYTVVATRYDAVVTPTSTAFVDEPGVRNRYVQDDCRLDPVGHVGIAFDSGVTSLILNGLDPRRPVRCGFGPPL